MIISYFEDIVIIRLVGTVVHQCEDDLKTALKEQLHAGKKKFVLDLSEVELLTSSCLGLFYTAQHDIRRQGGCLAILSPQSAVRSTIEDWRLERFTPIFDSIEDARQYMNALLQPRQQEF